MEEENTEYIKLPVEERCVHKLWKARLNGYEEASKIFRQLDDDKSPEWNKYVALLKKFVVDSNVSAQEKGLEAVLAFIENYGHAGRNAAEVMSALVQKCVAAPRAKTKDLALQISLMYIEIEKHEIVIEELLKGTENKNPKVSHGCLVILHQALKEFGARVINVGKILKKMPTILNDRDKSVRDQGKILVVEIYRWIGAALKPQLSSLKPVQLTELESEFEKVPSGITAPTRLLRSQQAKKAASGVSGDGPGDDGPGAELIEEQEIDPTEFLEPVDILNKLPKDFYTQLEAKKWIERRDALENLEKELAAAPRLETGEYGDLVRALKKIVAKDSNVAVIAVALKCLTGLANGLKKKFSPYVVPIFPTILEKFKEKKQPVVVASRELVDAIFPFSNLEALSEDIVAALENKNPGVKIETALFLARCFCRCTPAILNKKLLKILIGALIKNLNESELPVRDASAQAVGTAMKVVGEKAIGPFIGEPGEAKMAKIKSYYEKAELQKPIASAREASSEINDGSKSSKSGSSKPSSKVTKKVISGQKSNSVKQPVVQLEADARFATLSPQITAGLNSSSSNERKKSWDDLIELVKKNIQVPILPLLSVGSGLDDPSSDVMVSKYEFIKVAADVGTLSTLSQSDVTSLVLMILKKLSDHKHFSEVSSCLSRVANTLNSDDIGRLVLSPEIKKEPELWALALKWICEGIMHFDVSFSEEFLQGEAKQAIDQENFSIRSSGLALIGTLQIIPKKSNSTKSNLKKKDGGVSGTAPSEDGAPPLDLSLKSHPGLMAELTDDAWKVRFDALAKVQVLVDSSSSVSSDLGEFSSVVEELLVDKNSKVVVSVLNLISSICKIMGPSCRQYSRAFMPKVLKNLSDPKVWVRSAVLSTLNTWGGVAGFKEFFDNEGLADVVKVTSLPISRVELWNWFSSVLSNAQSLPKDGLVACLPHLYASIDDRSAEIRKAAGDALPCFMIHLGYDAMLAAVDNIKCNSQNIRIVLEKNRGCVPELVETSQKFGMASKQKPGSSATFVRPSKKPSLPVPRKTTISSRKQGEDENIDVSSPLLEVNSLKHQRVVDEQKLKTLRWNFTSPRPEFIEQLKDQMTVANINEMIILNMFNADFRFHTKAIDALAEDLAVNKRGLICNLDLILRWMSLRFFDTNPSVLLKGLEYLNVVFTCLMEEEYVILDYEASSFIPYLLLKAGDPKDTVRNFVKNIFRSMSYLHPRMKMFNYLMDGLKSKNSRQRSEILEHIWWLIESYSISACCTNPAIPLKEIAKHIGDRDVSVRNGALNCMIAVYFQEGEKLYKYIGQISRKDSTMLEERIKRACKNKPVAKPLQTDINVGYVNEPGPSADNEVEATEVSEVPEPPVVNDDNNVISSAPASPLQQSVRATGPHRLDPMSDDEEQPVSAQCLMPEIENIDLHFLRDTPKKDVATVPVPPIAIKTPVSHSLNSPAALKWDINQISNPDLEKAIHAMSQIENLFVPDKIDTLRPFLDLLVQQLVQQLIYLNQSTHPDLVSCYRKNFTLIFKISDYKQLCQEMSEANTQKLIKQLLLLLTENRLEAIGQPMFIKVVNNNVIHLLESANKTFIMCSLIRLLGESINSSSSKHFEELVTKCLWKMNRQQSGFDAELNYSKILTEVNSFFQDYPSSWWKSQESDVPIRTIKTIIHTMVKQRGSSVKESLKFVTSMGPDSELCNYIRKVIRHLKLDVQPDCNISSEKIRDSSQTCKTKENPELMQLISHVAESQEPIDNSVAIKRLYDYKFNHPDVDFEYYLTKFSLSKRNVIKRSLDMLERNTTIKENQLCTEGSFDPKKDVERVLKRLSFIKEQAGVTTNDTNQSMNKEAF